MARERLDRGQHRLVIERLAVERRRERVAYGLRERARVHHRHEACDMFPEHALIGEGRARAPRIDAGVQLGARLQPPELRDEPPHRHRVERLPLDLCVYDGVARARRDVVREPSRLGLRLARLDVALRCPGDARAHERFARRRVPPLHDHAIEPRPAHALHAAFDRYASVLVPPRPSTRREHHRPSFLLPVECSQRPVALPAV